MSLFNKSGGKAELNRAHAWHPNFRNVEQLPDTKTVRTRFFVNVTAIAATVALGLFVAIREANLASLRGELETVEAEISETKSPSDKAIQEFRKYQAEEKRFAGANTLVSNAFRFSDFLIHMAEILPQGVKVSRVDFRGTNEVVNLSGSILGLDASASDIASEYVKTLQADDMVKTHFSTVTLTNLGRNVAEGNMNFDLVLAFKKAPAAGGQK